MFAVAQQKRALAGSPATRRRSARALALSDIPYCTCHGSPIKMSPHRGGLASPADRGSGLRRPLHEGILSYYPSRLKQLTQQSLGPIDTWQQNSGFLGIHKCRRFVLRKNEWIKLAVAMRGCRDGLTFWQTRLLP